MKITGTIKAILSEEVYDVDLEYTQYDPEMHDRCEGCSRVIGEDEPRHSWHDGVVTCEKCGGPQDEVTSPQPAAADGEAMEALEALERLEQYLPPDPGDGSTDVEHADAADASRDYQIIRAAITRESHK